MITIRVDPFMKHLDFAHRMSAWYGIWLGEWDVEIDDERNSVIFER